MEQRLSLITLEAADLDRAIAFYRAMGWEPARCGIRPANG